MKLALGTVQFGMPYGIANRSGQVTQAEAKHVLAYGRSVGMDTLDTAAAYGDSESRLGDIGVRDWRVVTKVPALPPDLKDAGTWLRGVVETSLRRLKVPRLGGLLLHRSADLIGPAADEIFGEMVRLQEEGLVGKTGVSIYSPLELDHIGGRYPLQLVQAPFNVLDRRLEVSGWLTRLQSAGTEVHVRSVFLQGLLLLRRDERPRKFERWHLLWKQWESYLTESAQTPLEAALRFVLAQPGVSRVVVGVDSSIQLKEIVAAISGEKPRMADLRVHDDLLVDPSKWPLLEAQS